MASSQQSQDPLEKKDEGPESQKKISSAADEAILGLFKLIDQRTKIANLLGAYERARNLPMRNRESVYLILYFALEKFILSNRQPVVKAQFSKEELRRYIRQRIDINELGPRLKLIFVPDLYQSILLFDLMTKDLVAYISTNLGQLRYTHVISASVRGTMFEALWKTGINAPIAEGMFHEGSKDEVLTSLTTLFDVLYGEVEKFFGKKIADSIVNKSYTFVTSKYDDEIANLFFQILPTHILSDERIKFLKLHKLVQSRSDALGPSSNSVVESDQKSEASESRKFLGLGESPETIAITRAAEENLREERDLVRAIIDSIGDGVFVVDRSGSIMMMNPVAARLLGIIASQSIGKRQTDLFQLYKNEKLVADEENPPTKVLKTGNSVSLKLVENAYYKTSAGKNVPVELTASPLWKNTVSIEEGITGCIIVFRDITEQRKMDEVKSNFLSIASHQLRMPLTAMKWFLEMVIEGDAGPLTPEQKDFLQKAYESSEQMGSLVNHFLQIVRVETNRLKVEPVVVSFTEMSERIILTLKTNPIGKNQQFVVEADASQLPKVPMDYDILWQVILNLLSNASRYSPREGKIIARAIFDDKKQEIIYSVQDFGIGIPENQKDLIFKKFFRANNAIKAAPDGTGVGMWLAKALVESWGGKIWFESAEQKGTTFYFTIPVKGMSSQATDVPLTA